MLTIPIFFFLELISARLGLRVPGPAPALRRTIPPTTFSGAIPGLSGHPLRAPFQIPADVLPQAHSRSQWTSVTLRLQRSLKRGHLQQTFRPPGPQEVFPQMVNNLIHLRPMVISSIIRIHLSKTDVVPPLGGYPSEAQAQPCQF